MGTTPQDVRDITGSKLSDDDMCVFISAAEGLLLLIPDQTELLPTASLNMARAFLSAHILTMTKKGGDLKAISSEGLGGKYDVDYTVANLGEGIMGTTYGQTANIMLSGRLDEIGRPEVGMFSVGSI